MRDHEMGNGKSTTNNAGKASLDDLARDWLLFAKAIQGGLEGLGVFANRIQPILAEFWKTLATLADGISATAKTVKRLDHAGWLPHVTTPWSTLANAEISGLSQAIEQHYRDNWAVVKKTFDDRLDTYAIDEEAKATFREALAAHEQHLYRAAVRLLFPEIERVTRIEFRRFMTKRTDTSQKTLRQIAGGLPLGDHGNLLAFRLYVNLRDHLYGDIWDDSANERFSRDPIPNRHAAVHGFVTYSTARNSINTLIMAEYIFHLVTVVKKRLEQTKAGA